MDPIDCSFIWQIFTEYLQFPATILTKQFHEQNKDPCHCNLVEREREAISNRYIKKLHNILEIDR